jgi:hypothetical protein
MGALPATYAGWTGRPWGESTRPDLAVMGPTSLVVHFWKPQHYLSRIRGARLHSAARRHSAARHQARNRTVSLVSDGQLTIVSTLGMCGND